MDVPSPSQWSLPADLLVELFPFHIAFDRQLNIVQVGRSINQLYPTSLARQRLDDYFVINRPKVALSFEVIQKRLKSLFVLASRHGELMLKGQMTCLPDGNLMLFLCSPSVIDAQQLVDIGIHLRDFPLHDVTPDLIFLQRTTQMSVQQVEGLNQQLVASQEQLQDALKIQEHLRFKAEQQAKQLERQLKELKETQIQLVQAEKMSTLGQLLSGIVHEINNPLHCIHGNLDHCLEYTQELTQFCRFLIRRSGLDRECPELADDEADQFAHLQNLTPEDYQSLAFTLDDFPQVIRAMRVGTDRIREIVKGLRNFSRLDATALEEFDVHEGIDNTLMILKHRLTKTNLQKPIQVIKNYTKVPAIYCYFGQINQVLMNILANAIDALEDREQGRSHCPEQFDRRAGTPRLTPHSSDRDSNSDRHQPTIWIQTDLNHQGWLQIKIRDNAGGMPATVKERIFEPFFTTKPGARGTGLGMSISYQIVTERHGGCLLCDSQPDVGTEFTIELPINRSQLAVGQVCG